MSSRTNVHPTADRDGTAALTRSLWAAHQIRQLAYRFAHAHDSRDMHELESLFVPADEPLTWPEFNVVNARTRLPEYFQVAGPTMLFVANHIVDLVDDDHATGAVYCLAKLDIAGSWIEQAIQYHDTYERRDGRWLFAQRRHLLWYGIELPERPFDQPKTQWPFDATGRGSLPEALPAWRAYYGITEEPAGYYGQPQ
jgi:hypothetical protein